MGKMIRLKARDGHELDAYVAEPKGAPRGGLVVVQEIFGVMRPHQRSRRSIRGAKAIARSRPRCSTASSAASRCRTPTSNRGARTCSSSSGRTRSPTSTPRSTQYATPGRPAIVGYCWGGTVAHVAASELDFDAAISYYGGGVAACSTRQPQCPIMYHFGDQDGAIPMADSREDHARLSERGGPRLQRRGPRLQLRRAREL